MPDFDEHSRLSVLINDEVALLLDQAKGQGASATETVRRAFGVYRAVKEAQERHAALWFVEEDGSSLQVLFDI